ncbi:MAG: NADH-quinone oxidoreductase subunit C [Dehalococcoidia bacterium]|nr:MAG: NADH-quinone oxidoreductase subunit C [Dehalococcoidia bacterium]
MQELELTAVAERLKKELGDNVIVEDEISLVIAADRLSDLSIFLHDDLDLNLDYLSSVTAVDYKTHFEIVYHLVSLTKEHRLVFKVRVDDHENPSLPTVINVWRGADLQEREIFDLFGINFDGHPNMKRLFLWEGFPGHPMRKDWVSRDA